GAARGPLPEAARAEVPEQPAEKRARAAYQKLIEQFADSLLSVDARFEAAEMYCEREDFDSAVKMLKEANDVEPRGDKLPSPELVDKIRIRLGACLAAKKDLDTALGYFDAVGNNPKSTLDDQSLYLNG